MSWDFFASDVPVFNFEGRNRIGSKLGIVGTLFFGMGLLSFTAFKVTRFVTGSNPLIVQAEEEDAYTVDDDVDLKDVNMLFAF